MPAHAAADEVAVAWRVAVAVCLVAVEACHAVVAVASVAVRVVRA